MLSSSLLKEHPRCILGQTLVDSADWSYLSYLTKKL